MPSRWLQQTDAVVALTAAERHTRDTAAFCTCTRLSARWRGDLPGRPSPQPALHSAQPRSPTEGVETAVHVVSPADLGSPVPVSARNTCVVRPFSGSACDARALGPRTRRSATLAGCEVYSLEKLSLSASETPEVISPHPWLGRYRTAGASGRCELPRTTEIRRWVERTEAGRGNHRQAHKVPPSSLRYSAAERNPCRGYSDEGSLAPRPSIAAEKDPAHPLV